MTEAIPEDVMKVAREAASKLLSDITDRKGWRQEYDQFDEDVRLEIRESHTGIIAEAILEERERCAKVALDYAQDVQTFGSIPADPFEAMIIGARDIAAAIRKGDSR